MGEALYSGKTAVITGSTLGLGEAIARKLTAEKASGITICGRNSERGEALAEELTQQGTPTIFVRAELENPDECSNLVSHTITLEDWMDW